jgi:hypothetical protein
MATIGDVLDRLQDVINSLQPLHPDMNDLKAASAKIDQTLNTRLGAIQQVLQDGFVNLAQGIQASLIQQNFANKALAELVAEEKTMICQLEQIAEQTCQLLSEAHFQTGLQTEMRTDLDRVLQITRTQHPGAELELQRLDALKAEIERCCPTEPEPPLCTHQPCSGPPGFAEQPPSVDYKPLQAKEPPK